MRFSYAESMCDPSHYATLAVAAEEAGFTGFTVPDSVCYAEHDDTVYPYTHDGSREFLEGKPFIELFTLIPYLAALTTRLRFDTFVMKLPIRNPVLVAKQATSIAVLSDNRLGLGVGLSPWPQDFAATGMPWPGRGKRTDEMIEIIRGLASGDYYAFTGEHFEIDSIKLTPAPTRPIPILIGGHSDAALRRAARLGDGWMQAGGEFETLRAQVARIHALRAEYGRAEAPFEVHAFVMEQVGPEDVQRYADAGVTDMIIALRNPYEPDTQPLELKVELLRGFSEAVIAKS